MVLVIDDSSDIPIYQQLRNQIVMGISDGRLKPGERLPTGARARRGDWSQCNDGK